MENSANKICQHNASFWDQEAVAQKSWSQPVSPDIIAASKRGEWTIYITKKPVPHSWLPRDIKGKNILCLASAGGQQAPVLAAVGADVTVYDISEKQLSQDQYVAKRDGLVLTMMQGDMADPSQIADSTFDYIINPISNLYIEQYMPTMIATKTEK